MEHRARKAVTRLELRKVTIVDRENGAAGDCSVCLEPMMVSSQSQSTGHFWLRQELKEG